MFCLVIALVFIYKVKKEKLVIHRRKMQKRLVVQNKFKLKLEWVVLVVRMEPQIEYPEIDFHQKIGKRNYRKLTFLIF